MRKAGWGLLGGTMATIALGLTAVAALAPPGADAYTPEQVALGGRVYAAECARCHGERGEGAGPDSADATFLVGPRALIGYRTMAQVYSYVTEEMPPDNPGTLSAEQTWAVLAWLMSQNRIAGPGPELGPATAAGIATQP